MSLTHAAFAIAGLIAAGGPVIIHLLNRRRFRTVEWGAMAFLRKAMQRSRRSLRLRDLLLLVLRTAAVLLFGFALARPVLSNSGVGGLRFVLLVGAILAAFGGAIGLAFAAKRSRRIGWSTLSLVGVVGLVGLIAGPGGTWSAARVATASSREPVHAIVVVDNSRSMGARTLDGTLLDAAIQRASAAIGTLPRGSQVSVLPLCGPERSFTLDAHLHLDEAQSALGQITITDRAGSALQAFSLAAEAARRVPELPAKRIVFLSDQQATGWPRSGVVEATKNVGGPVQIVDIARASGGRQPSEPPNVWIEAFTVQDGLAEANQPTTFLATIRCTGDRAVDDVEIVLSHDGRVATSQSVDLRPGQARDVTLAARLDADVDPGSPTFVPATLSLRVAEPSTNELERDDARHLAVPVVTAIPVVFVDQYGDGENLDAGRIGETYRLRRLLAPRPAEGVYDPLVEVRRATFQTLTQQSLEDARLVVVAGVERPADDGVRLLRQYVEQGGPLVIAAGANFDPAAWTATAWLDGRGILPAPLADSPVGVRPSQATSIAQIEPFRLDAASLGHLLFQIAGESSSALADLWSQPFFFQAVAANVSDATVKRAIAAETERITAERAALSGGTAEPTELAPSWLLWKTAARASAGDNPDVGPLTLEVLASRTTPQVLARFAKSSETGDGLPYLVERRLGYGRVLLLTSGLSSDWDTLAQTNAIVLLDRITRSLLEETLPRRDHTTGDSITLPIERRADVVYQVSRPGGEPRPLTAEATATGYALRLDDTSLAGSYAVTTQRESEAGAPLESIALAVNGPVEESDLTPLESNRFTRLVGDADVRRVGPADELELSGGPARGNLWKWLVGAVLACLLAEMAVFTRWRSSATEDRR
ncbi:MAG: BatA domain-containing protein [Planctomycetaceae bacterium]